MVLVSIVLLLTLFTGSIALIKEAVSYTLIIVLLYFLTADIKFNSNKKKSSNTLYNMLY